VHVILDVDTGVDDALAILVALGSSGLGSPGLGSPGLGSPGLVVRAITCVAGNVGVDQVVTNTLKVLDAAGAPEIPTGRGAQAGPTARVRSVHGADGLADLGLPDSSRRPVAEPAIELIRREIDAAPEPVTLLALGPLTNVAGLLRGHPGEAGTLAGIVIVGGGTQPGFNLEYDPAATRTVLAARVPVIAYSMDVFAAVTVPRARAERLARSDDPAAALAGQLLLHQSRRFGGDTAPLGDAGAVASVLDPAGLATVRRGGVDTAVGVDAERYQRLVLAALTARPAGRAAWSAPRRRE